LHGADGGRAVTAPFVVAGGVVAFDEGALVVVGASVVVVDANVVDGATVVDVVDVDVDVVLVLVVVVETLVDTALIVVLVVDDELPFVQPAAAATSISPPSRAAPRRIVDRHDGGSDDDRCWRTRLVLVTGPCRGTVRPRR
jgi:hypothetical protein